MDRGLLVRRDDDCYNTRYIWRAGEADMEERVIRKAMVFFGTVQGVGFRWRARHAAASFGCTGWCRNEWDGSVTMEIQGTAERIDRVLRAIREGRYVQIEETRSRTIPVDPEERGFHTM